MVTCAIFDMLIDTYCVFGTILARFLCNFLIYSIYYFCGSEINSLNKTIEIIEKGLKVIDFQPLFIFE